MRLIDEVIVVLFARLFSIVTKHSFIKKNFNFNFDFNFNLNLLMGDVVEEFQSIERSIQFIDRTPIWLLLPFNIGGSSVTFIYFRLRKPVEYYWPYFLRRMASKARLPNGLMTTFYRDLQKL